MIVAGAGGRLVAKAAEDFARAVAAAQGAQLVVRDVRPLPSGDEIGVGVFMFMIVCTICGYLAVTLLFTVAPALPPSRRYPIIAAIAVLVPTLAYLIGGLGFGTYTGSFGTILAFIGVGGALRVRHRPDHPPAPGAHRPASAVRVARDLRVPEHPEPRRHLHARAAPRLLALPQPLLDRGGDDRRRAQHPLLRRAGRRHRPAQAARVDGRDRRAPRCCRSRGSSHVPRACAAVCAKQA